MSRRTRMTPDQWRQIRNVVESALELEPHERERLLNEGCAGDASLRSEVESLLRAYDAGGSLDQPAVDLNGVLATSPARPFLGEPEIAVGEMIGPYRILEELGHGGMGTVYLARREDGEAERVAVKVAQHGLPRHAWRRFHVEYRILAALDHPGIAKVLDAGATDDGRPYFVMEHIEGTEIETYCREHDLPASARLELILKVCDAVDAAHRQGVIHRDLKPSNILVTPKGEPKLLDFGIAKLLDPEAQSFTVEPTRTNEHPLTPQYASPEQIRGQEITPRSDVYSLGVVLYKLMTDRLPYLVTHCTLAAMAVAFEEQTPPRPGAIATAPEFELLSGDFDPALMRALSVDVEARFESVTDFRRALRPAIDGRQSTTRIVLGRLRRLRFAASRMLAGRREAVYSWAAVVVVVVGMTAVYFGTNLHWSSEDVPVAPFSFKERDRIVVGEFRNLTGEPILDDSLELAFRFGIESSSYVRVVSREHVRDALVEIGRDPEVGIDSEVGIEIGRREGAKALVLGSVGKVEGRYRVFAELIGIASGNRQFTTSAVAANQDDLVVTLQEVCDNIRIQLGEKPDGIVEEGRLERVISTSLPALRAYIFGLGDYEKDEFESALGFLERAISIDPEFAMAHAKIGSVFWNSGRRELVRQYFATASELPGRLTEFERLNVRARLAFFDGTLEENVDSWSSLIELYPDNYVAYYNLATVLSILGYDPDQAAQIAEQGLRWSPIDTKEKFLYRLSLYYLTLGRKEEYQSTVQMLNLNLSRASQVGSLLVGAMFDRRDRQTQELLEEAKIIRGSVSDSVFHHFLVHCADFGRIYKIKESVARRVPLDESRNLDYECLSVGIYVQFEMHVFDKKYFDISIEKLRYLLSDVPAERNRLKIQGLATLGKILAQSSAMAEAEAISGFVEPFPKTMGLPFWVSYSYVLEGEILAATGRHAEAIQRFREALEIQETFQVHDSLAQAYERNGMIAAAIEESNWLVAHRGRALFEDDSSFVRVQNVISWHLAILRLARLHESLGKMQDAIEYYQQFVDNWRDGDRPPVWHEAQNRLETLLAEQNRGDIP